MMRSESIIAELKVKYGITVELNEAEMGFTVATADGKGMGVHSGPPELRGARALLRELRRIVVGDCEDYTDLRPLLDEPDAAIKVSRHELLRLCVEADVALNGSSGDDEHEALYSLREWLGEFLEAPERRI